MWMDEPVSVDRPRSSPVNKDDRVIIIILFEDVNDWRRGWSGSSQLLGNGLGSDLSVILPGQSDVGAIARVANESNVVARRARHRLKDVVHRA